MGILANVRVTIGRVFPFQAMCRPKGWRGGEVYHVARE